MTTPTLPPEFLSGNDIPVERSTIMRARMAEIQLAAYQAGRGAGLEEAAQFCECEGALYTGLDMAVRIRALKSDAKEPA